MGMTKTEYREYLQGEHWRARRKMAIEAAGSQCWRCQIPRWLAELVYDQDLHVHHLNYSSLGNEQDEDLEVLCRRCHDIETHGRSELRAPKHATCEACRQKHWNPRSDKCPTCQAIISCGLQSPNISKLSDPGNTEVWRMVLCQLAYDITDDEIFEELRRVRERERWWREQLSKPVPF